MKRFAAHYIYLPAYGFLKYYAIETTDAGNISRIFPLVEESDSVEWHPGVILFSPEKEWKDNASTQSDTDEPLGDWTESIQKDATPFTEHLQREEMYPYLLYPFDFISMKPASGTRHIPLR